MLEAARSRLKAWIVAGIGTAAAIAVAGVLGAFGARHEPMPALAPTSRIETGQWLLQPLKAYVTEGKDAYGAPLKPGGKALVLQVEMTNRTAKSSKDYFEILRASQTAADAATKPFIVLMRDATLSPELHPGMPERMAYIWEMQPGAVSPTSFDLTVIGKTYKQRDNLYGLPGWFNPTPIGTLTLAVGAGPDTAQVQP
ncbi:MULTISPECIES: hypothetical protein [unclassified Mesorhizobium]|uniref:hypothetical protein n=1 Tax=unclassified Mesorhizobium TaxID=325217 RepID=UPI000FCAD9A1|nr:MULTISPECIES: hypothetical protein [unclassified Mesorhizobium]RUW65524.1 hypothetical protein EOA31_33515 [Mesorhizobium sp. M4B.F.Ca.ET.049.02.1.2]TGV27953.1 hypothetical protein EN786_07445 [Mesorhizobium sp. M4B.F.Ca.ET.143.01.1.1]